MKTTIKRPSNIFYKYQGFIENEVATLIIAETGQRIKIPADFCQLVEENLIGIDKRFFNKCVANLIPRF